MWTVLDMVAMVVRRVEKVVGSGFGEARLYSLIEWRRRDGSRVYEGQEGDLHDRGCMYHTCTCSFDVRAEPTRMVRAFLLRRDFISSFRFVSSELAHRLALDRRSASFHSYAWR